MKIRKLITQVDETFTAAGETDAGSPLRKVAVAAVVQNPFAGEGFVSDLSRIVDESGEIAALVGSRAAKLLDAPVESYGKGGVAGIAGEQEHINAALTSVFGDVFRREVGGGRAWITSVTKVAGMGASIDVPLAYKDEIWVRSHYDAIEVHLGDAPYPHELVIIAAVANRGRLNARIGGMTVADAIAKGDGQ